MARLAAVGAIGFLLIYGQFGTPLNDLLMGG
jgi:hypothetical protein